MSEIIKTIDELFSPLNGDSKYTKSYCQEHKGEYIVYTGTTLGIFGKVDKADFSTPTLTFTTDGENAGTIEYITDNGYCIGGHRTILNPKTDDLYLPYFKFILQPLFYKRVKKGDVPSLRFDRIKKEKVAIPIRGDGKFDLEKQIDLANKYTNIEVIKNTLLKKVKLLQKYRIILDFNEEINFKNIGLNEIIKHNNGNASYTREWCRQHSGKIPVYSANNSLPIDYMNKGDYSGRFLTYSKNGCAGYITIIDGSFSVNGDRCVMTINPGYDRVDLDYLKYYLEPIFRANIKGRIGINGKNEYTKLNSTMIKKLNIQVPIPIKSNGEFDLNEQKRLAKKYATIELIKKNLYEQINQLTKISVL